MMNFIQNSLYLFNSCISSLTEIFISQIDEILKTVPHSSGAGYKDIKVLRLPTKHCFFNPIELVWAYIKGYVARKNASCNLGDVETLTRAAITQVIL